MKLLYHLRKTAYNTAVTTADAVTAAAIEAADTADALEGGVPRPE